MFLLMTVNISIEMQAVCYDLSYSSTLQEMSRRKVIRCFREIKMGAVRSFNILVRNDWFFFLLFLFNIPLLCGVKSQMMFCSETGMDPSPSGVKEVISISDDKDEKGSGNFHKEKVYSAAGKCFQNWLLNAYLSKIIVGNVWILMKTFTIVSFMCEFILWGFFFNCISLMQPSMFLYNTNAWPSWFSMSFFLRGLPCN